MCLVHIASLCICFSIESGRSRSPALNITTRPKQLAFFCSSWYSWAEQVFFMLESIFISLESIWPWKKTKCSRFSKFRDCCEMYFLNTARRSSLDIQMFRGLWMFHTTHVPLLRYPASACFFPVRDEQHPVKYSYT